MRCWWHFHMANRWKWETFTGKHTAVLFDLQQALTLQSVAHHAAVAPPTDRELLALAQWPNWMEDVRFFFLHCLVIRVFQSSSNFLQMLSMGIITGWIDELNPKHFGNVLPGLQVHSSTVSPPVTPRCRVLHVLGSCINKVPAILLQSPRGQSPSGREPTVGWFSPTGESISTVLPTPARQEGDLLWRNHDLCQS